MQDEVGIWMGYPTASMALTYFLFWGGLNSVKEDATWEV